MVLKNWTHLKADKKYFGSFEKTGWRRVQKISWTDGVKMKNNSKSHWEKEHRTYNKSKDY